LVQCDWTHAVLDAALAIALAIAISLVRYLCHWDTDSVQQSPQDLLVCCILH